MYVCPVHRGVAQNKSQLHPEATCIKADAFIVIRDLYMWCAARVRAIREAACAGSNASMQSQVIFNTPGLMCWGSQEQR